MARYLEEEDEDDDEDRDDDDDDEEEGKDAYNFVIALLGNGGVKVSDPECLGRNALRHQIGASPIY